MDEKIAKLFLPLLDKLYNTEPAGEPFRKPVDVVKYGCYDYYLYVKHPIDLSTIREKLLTHQYQGDAWRFVADIQIMFSNAYLFNKKGTPVYEFTNKLSKIWNQELSPIMQRLNYCCGTLHKFGPQLLFCHGTTQDKYCQIPIGAKYKCYQDQYSFCMPCFNKIDSDFVNIQNLSCETTRMKLPTQPVKKSDFIDCANDVEQYERFVECTQCTRRVHQICDLYPASEDELQTCIQHDELEDEQKATCKVPEAYREYAHEHGEIVVPDSPNIQTITTTTPKTTTNSSIDRITIENLETQTSDQLQHTGTSNRDEIPEISKDESMKDNQNEESIKIEDITKSEEETFKSSDQSHQQPSINPTSLDDELLQFAKDVDDFANSVPTSPNPEAKQKLDSAKSDSMNCHKKSVASSGKNSVDNIAARLSINKMNVETVHLDESEVKNNDSAIKNRDKFVCNHCYRKKKIGFNLRHRKYSARRLPHTRMSRYIETKVNEHIREHSPTAGEVTIRVLTAYEDIVTVKSEMKEYINNCRQKDSSFQHPNAKNYPDQFNYINRAIFAWQEIDGVDVCVFGMHVQEYGEDCPEPNRQVVYLSYLDSVHFFRPKQVRTAVYHEILLSYFKYVKKLGFRRVFIWVCPSRKGDDYIFYRHPTEQKMPTLKRLSDWYINLLDKGIMAGIVEKHHNIYQYAISQNWNSILNIPYLSGDYWPGEFERMLNIMIESQKEYEKKQEDRIGNEEIMTKSQDISDTAECSNSNNSINNFNNLFSPTVDRCSEQNNISPFTANIYQKRSANSTNSKLFNLRDQLLSSHYSILRQTNGSPSMNFTQDSGDYRNMSTNTDYKNYDNLFSPSSSTNSDQPLDLSKSSNSGSPEMYHQDNMTNNPGKKKRKKSNMSGYTKKRSRVSSQKTQIPSGRLPMSNHQNSQICCEGSAGLSSKTSKAIRQKSCTQSRDSCSSDQILSPEEELAKNLERSLKRQREGFIIARLNECDCSPHFESLRRKEETTFTCELMKGREPFLQLARIMNWEFSSIRRAKFSSLAMIKHLGQSFKLEPICNECFSFDSSKRHLACSQCHDFYLCTSCHDNTHHEHSMTLVPPTVLPDIDDFLQQCSLTSNSISSASSTISNKSFNESNLDIATQACSSPTGDLSETASTPLNRYQANSLTSSTMPLGCKRQKNQSFDTVKSSTRAEDEENAKVCPFDNGTTKHVLGSQSIQPPPSHSANSIRTVSNSGLEFDQVLVDNFIRQAEVSYDVDFDEMKSESKKLLTHYWTCPARETCHRCKFVVLSCSFMSILMRSASMQLMANCDPAEIFSGTNNNNNNSSSGINLTTAHRIGYQPKDK